MSLSGADKQEAQENIRALVAKQPAAKAGVYHICTDTYGSIAAAVGPG